MNTELNNYIDSLSIKYKAIFIPFSASRNSEEKTKSINWVCVLEKSGKSIKVEYSQGTGHLPKRIQTRGAMAENEACENGAHGGCKVNPPKLVDILYCLVLDSSVLDHSSFEGWAGDFGYDTDSIKALEIYKECKKQANQFRNLFSASERAKLAELFQDY